MTSSTLRLAVALALSTCSSALSSQRDDSLVVPFPFGNLEDVHIAKRDSSKTVEAPLVIYVSQLSHSPSMSSTRQP